MIRIGLGAGTPIWLAAARATLSAATAFVLVAALKWLLAAGFTWALAILHARRHAWRMSPLDVLPWQMGVASVLLWLLAVAIEPSGRLDFCQPALWVSLLYLGVLAGPTATWAAVSVARVLPPVTGSLGMLGVPLLGIASSVVLVGEPVTWPLAIGTALVIAGIASVILTKTKPES